jgi:molybdopterin-guanine dinucleotide biosynthesis protein B
LYRSDLSPGLYCRSKIYKDPDLIAVASDVPLEIEVPVLDLNDPEAVGEFIVERFGLKSSGKGCEQ